MSALLEQIFLAVLFEDFWPTVLVLVCGYRAGGWGRSLGVDDGLPDGSADELSRRVSGRPAGKAPCKSTPKSLDISLARHYNGGRGEQWLL